LIKQYWIKWWYYHLVW
jgi:CAAX amino terminal protease family.